MIIKHVENSAVTRLLIDFLAEPGALEAWLQLEPDPYAVPCPACEAPVGEMCRDTHGHYLPREYPHPGRVAAV